MLTTLVHGGVVIAASKYSLAGFQNVLFMSHLIMCMQNNNNTQMVSAKELITS